MANEIVFTNKEKALISVTASIAAGCQPCTEHHVNGARSAGACDRSIALSVETALAVRESASRNMEAWAARCAGPRPEIPEEFQVEKRLVMELAAVAAAVAVNSVPDVLARADSARLAGATPQQILGAVSLATSIRGTAGQKVEVALGLAAAKPGACCESPGPDVPQAAGNRATTCGCGQ